MWNVLSLSANRNSTSILSGTNESPSEFFNSFPKYSVIATTRLITFGSKS